MTCERGAAALILLLTACNGVPHATPATGFASSLRSPAASSSGDLLYVSDWHSGKIFIFTYPGQTLVGTIVDKRYPLGLCSDAAGDVWVTDFGAGANQIVEYARGSTHSVATLDDPKEEPRGCAVNPVTGDLAVANGSPGNVVIYAHASGSPQSYGPKLSYPFACTYDSAGNLYVDGYHLNGGDKFALSELPHGASKFEALGVIKGSGQLGMPGNIQWDGTDLAAGDYPLSNTIYRFRISQRSTSARLEETVSLDGPVRDPALGVQFSLQGGRILMPYGTGKNLKAVGVWNYPAGGRHVESWSKFGGTELYGVTISAR
jgi:DNA-binding beta-propeller fold protein YncE